ncbi:hypothetical protein OBBRIDRAFT_799418 [Obba rivulosa]|uniref:Envelope glycoprotein n=1 Tax=Obba rivulosa TaxID=1052685 RepID=A0A8E2DDS3_9APHY|nr:hypothetical protein OBBRIDRAFT_799418 [Obba rivulosa]
MFPLFFIGGVATIATAILGSKVNHQHHAHIDFDGSRMLREALEQIRATAILQDMQQQFRDTMIDLRANSDHIVVTLEKTTAALTRDVHTLVVALVALIVTIILYIVWCGILRGLAEARERRTARVRLAFYDQGKWVLCETSGPDLPLLQPASRAPS